MGMARFRGGKIYNEFVSYAKVGDKLLNEVIKDVIIDSDFSVEEKHTLLLYLRSNRFLNNFEVPFRYKKSFPTLHNCQKETVNLSKRVKNIRGDIAEAYIAWLSTNFGRSVAENYIYNQIIKITNNDTNKYNTI